jgi:NAD(P)-dependent dehydrogenase (short-subunit alcohol dehydrogenase family)
MTSKRKVVIITGASRGIGAAALVKKFRELDYGVVDHVTFNQEDRAYLR